MVVGTHTVELVWACLEDQPSTWAGARELLTLATGSRMPPIFPSVGDRAIAELNEPYVAVQIKTLDAQVSFLGDHVNLVCALIRQQ